MKKHREYCMSESNLQSFSPWWLGYEYAVVLAVLQRALVAQVVHAVQVGVDQLNQLEQRGGTMVKTQ